MSAWGRRIGCVVTAALVAACGGGVAPNGFAGDPATYLLSIDQLRDAGFTVLEPTATATATATAAHQTDVGDGGGDGARAAQRSGCGRQASARVRFFRTVNDLASVNGPVDVSAAVTRCNDAADASQALSVTIQRVESRTGEQPVSTGPLGDEAHADQVVERDAGGTRLVQFTVQWRLANLVNELVIRGRYGGTRIADAVALAARQVDNELSG